jgi:signal transduction histidine kinase
MKERHPPPPKPSTSQRLALLVEISGALMQFETVDHVIPAVLRLAGQAVPLRTGILIGGVETRSILRVWGAVDLTKEQVDEALEHARAAYQDAFGDEAPLAARLREARASVSMRVLPHGQRGAWPRPDQYILLPLVAGQRDVFGAVQFEPAERMDEEQLAFLSTVANLIAIALDRHVAFQREASQRARAQSLEQQTAELLRREHAALEQARAAMRSRDLFLAAASHDLRDLTGVADMAARLLLNSPPPSKQREWLEALKRATTRMRTLLADVLDTASIEDGHLSLVPERISLRPIAQRTADAFAVAADAHAVDLILEVPPDLPAVWGDARRLEQALDNLVKNAIHFSPAHGSVAIRASATHDMARMSVADQGPGIPREFHQSIFEPFWSAGRDQSRSSGLGLFIVKAIIDRHGGQVGVDSQPGQGSTLWFTLPLVRSPRRASAGARGDRKSKSVRGNPSSGQR